MPTPKSRAEVTSFVPLPLNVYLDAPAAARVLDGVLQEVEHYLLYSLPIGVYRTFLGRQSDFQVILGRGKLGRGGHVANKVAKVECITIEDQLAGLHTRHIEQIAHQPRQPIGLAIDSCEHLIQAFRITSADHPQGHLGKPFNRGNGRF